ncbi:hypothetical protein M0412_04280 [Agrobacterium sp. O3.4]|uniref:Uncharacterized protein n=1 Tax=Agrobacterium cucumeris TaxID=2862866 RepID=A0ABY8RQU0_9HYPH|nr:MULTISPECIES: hypothetical protein [Rhizobium/Agrobacterium group]MCZ7469725.1 hypothetical protein [Rhizobium rhizogenes]WHO09528.1 hypothetical protein KZ699_07070 [Agrobacterium cucumeris]
MSEALETLFHMSVAADAKWTPLCEIKKGQKYKFSAQGTWIDWYINTDANGYDRFWLRPFAAKKRAPKEKWFALIGALDQDESTAFLIGSEKIWVAPRSGQLWCFANDMPSKYGNNKGAITVIGSLSK